MLRRPLWERREAEVFASHTPLDGANEISDRS